MKFSSLCTLIVWLVELCHYGMDHVLFFNRLFLIARTTGTTPPADRLDVVKSLRIALAPYIHPVCPRLHQPCNNINCNHKYQSTCIL